MRAQQNLARVRSLVQQGVVPVNDLAKAQDDLNNALDESILRFSELATDLLPEQADQMVTVAERMFLRKQKRSMQTRQLVETGILARSEAEASSSDVISAKLRLDLAIERARLVKDMALQKQLAEVETEAESHPEWNGQIYTRYDGNGTFTRADFNKISAAFLANFGHMIPVSADGQTAVHTALGFNHAGRIDIALNPDQSEKARGCFVTSSGTTSRITHSGAPWHARLPARTSIWDPAARASAPPRNRAAAPDNRQLRFVHL